MDSPATLSRSDGAAGPDSRARFPAVARGLASLLAPIDIASLVYFRIGFGLFMAWWAFSYLATGRVRAFYVDPLFHFTYYGFDWVHPWPGAGMYVHFAVVGLLGICVAAGFLYRWTTPLLALGFTYVFLIDRSNYQNHYYLLTLLCWMTTLLPANRAWSFDAVQRPRIRSQAVPCWTLWLIRFHVALPYFFGGIAKFHSDWFAGEPMRQVLASKASFPVFGPWLASPSAVPVFIWGGLLFDLAVVPLLLWRWTRPLAFALCVLFHVTNSLLFSIHIFPWFMIFSTAMFFEPEWPRRLFRMPRSVPVGSPAPAFRSPQRWQVASIGVYCLFQLVWPLRHFLYEGDVSWHERGHYFAWHMMLRGKSTGIRYYMVEPGSGRTWVPPLSRILTLEQLQKVGRDPEMVLQLAQYLASEHHRQTGREVEVHALVLSSLNGRKPQLLVDPAVDLAREPRGFHKRPWIMPQNEPLRDEPWTVPLAEWERHVDLPPLPFLRMPAALPQRPQTTTALYRN